jgi:hypothetical protein
MPRLPALDCNGLHRACPAARRDAKTHSVRNPGDTKRSRTKDGWLAWMPLLSLAGHAFFVYAGSFAVP